MLSLEQTPPIGVPFRFFLTAPLLGVAAACLAAYAGPELLLSRWQPSLLAVTHLLTLGYMAIVMFGAMFQLLPVLAGIQIARSGTASAWVHALLLAGTALLATGFVTGRAPLFGAAIGALAAAVLLFVVVIGRALGCAKSLHETVWAMRLALAALMVTLLFGAWLAAGHAGWGALVRNYTDLHLAWGLLGWGGVLMAGVAYQVVPMFQVTAVYPVRLRRGLAWGVIGLLLVGSGLALAGTSERVTGLGLAALFVLFAMVTLRLQQRRLRRLPDVTVDYWRVGMGSVLAAALLWALLPHLPAAWSAGGELAWGVLVIVGAGVSVISGMLYKVVPFLVWLHLNNRLQAAGRWQGKIPNMRQIIGERAARWNLRLHVAALVFTLLAVTMPKMLFYPALAAVAASFLLQFWSVLAAWCLFRRLAAL